MINVNIMKASLTFLFICLLPVMALAQSVGVKKHDAKKLLDKIETYPVEVIDVKTLKKWRALELSPDMKAQMNYNVVRVKYKVRDTAKTMIFDMHMVPISLHSEAHAKTQRKQQSITKLQY